jgi:hypothetical protein
MALNEKFERIAAVISDHIYGGPEVTLEFEALDANVQFSNRRGEVARKRVPPMKLAA